MSIPNLSLADKVAIVTGGRRGIGKAIALAFAEAGADVAICDNVVETGELETTAEEIKKLGRHSLAVQADVTKKAEVDDFVQRVIDEFGFIDILVNNAAITINAPTLDFEEDDWDKVTDTDLKGYFLCAQAVGKRMAGLKRGNIINIASDDAFRASKGDGVPYGVAKAGVVMLTRILAKKLARYNIRVNAIAPGTVRAPISTMAWTNPEYMKELEASVPLGRIAETSDIVGPALFLASEASGYITGHTIVVDGGRMA